MNSIKHLSPTKQILPGIYRITLPLPGEKPGPVNVYLFTGKTITLLDTGTSKTVDHLRTALQELGYMFKDIDQIILSHGHIDHYGAASDIAGESGAAVIAHASDKDSVERGWDATVLTIFRFLNISGVPLRFCFTMVLLFFMFRSMAKKCGVTRVISEGDMIDMGDYRARVIETPGHTSGSLCFYLEKQRVLFSGDHILSHITPNAFAMLENRLVLPVRMSQMEFYQSLEKIEKLNIKKVYPAHGREIENLAEVTAMYRKSFKERQVLISSILAGGSDTIYNISRKLFPVFDRKRFILEIFLMVSEVYTHIQVMEHEGMVRTAMEKGKLIAEKI